MQRALFLLSDLSATRSWQLARPWYDSQHDYHHDMESAGPEVQVPLLPFSLLSLSDSPPTPSPVTATRSPDVWFDDGTLILEAGDTHFKVYRGILAANSTVFNDMLVVGSGSGEETVDGCPVVRVYDDATDLKHFLKALHHVGCAIVPSSDCAEC